MRTTMFGSEDRRGSVGVGSMREICESPDTLVWGYERPSIRPLTRNYKEGLCDSF